MPALPATHAAMLQCCNAPKIVPAGAAATSLSRRRFRRNERIGCGPPIAQHC
jgi:hypothetical protein